MQVVSVCFLLYFGSFHCFTYTSKSGINAFNTELPVRPRNPCLSYICSVYVASTDSVCKIVTLSYHVK